MDWTALWFDVLLSLGATAVTAGIAYRKHSAHSLLSSAIAYPPEKGGPKAYDGDLVVVEGTVSPAPNAVMEKPVLCVANLMSTIRHSARYDPIFRTWSSESTEVLRVARTLPFYLAKPTSSYLASQAVVSLAPNIDLESAGLEFPIISSSFAPSPPPTLGQLALDVLQGERVLGYETTERALPVGTRLTAVGILDFGRKVVSLPGVLGGSVVPTEPNESSVPMLVEKDGLPFLVGVTGFSVMVFTLLTDGSFSRSSRRHLCLPSYRTSEPARYIGNF